MNNNNNHNHYNILCSLFSAWSCSCSCFYCLLLSFNMINKTEIPHTMFQSSIIFIVVCWCGCKNYICRMNIILRVNTCSFFGVYSPISVFLLLLSLGLGSVGFYLQQPCSDHPQIMMPHSTRFQIMINDWAGLRY